MWFFVTDELVCQLQCPTGWQYLHRWPQSDPFCPPGPSTPPSQLETVGGQQQHNTIQRNHTQTHTHTEPRHAVSHHTLSIILHHSALKGQSVEISINYAGIAFRGDHCAYWLWVDLLGKPVCDLIKLREASVPQSKGASERTAWKQ